MSKPIKFAAALISGACALAACDKPKAAEAPAAAPATVPATQPTTRKAVRVPSFPPDGTYADGTKLIRIATGREAVAALVQRHTAQLSKGYNDPAAPAALLKRFDAGAAAAKADDRYVGAMVVTDNPPDVAPAAIYFMSNRGYVEVGRVVLADAAKARGGPVAFDPPVQVYYRLYRVDRDEPDPDAPAAAPGYSVMMSAASLSLLVRTDPARPRVGNAGGVPCALFAPADGPLLLDKALAAPPATRP